MNGRIRGQKTPLMGLMMTSAVSVAFGRPSSLAGLAGRACPCWTMEPCLGPGWSEMWDMCGRRERMQGGGARRRR